MARRSTLFVCQNCGSTSPKWMGRCPDCSTWGSLLEEARQDSRSTGSRPAALEPLPLTSIPEDSSQRVPSGLGELDRVLGGGMVPGSAILLGGDPGIGKSTLILQILSGLAGGGRKVLYVTAEESMRQIRMRALRTGSESGNLMVLAETDFSAVAETIRASSPDTVVLDSVQALYHPDIGSSPGSISQVREIANVAVGIAKSMEITTWLIGHVTKEGSIAGPRALEHLVDTVLYFEGDSTHAYRILRAVKNRYGSTNEIALLEMTGQGLVEVSDPAGLFLPSSGANSPGSTVVMGLEGSRTLLVEVQALVAQTPFANPRRTVSGADLSRVLLILAVLDRRAGIGSGGMDVFVNVAGGLRLTEPAADLGIALALVSSMWEKPMIEKTAVCGELGLSGEVRPVMRLESRLREAARLGLTRAIVPAAGADKLPGIKGMEVVPVETIEDAIEASF
ncbi:MAG: DNA repair protein RadA [bacterium]|nr:DNA repair protein RadA [bacterium]MDT8395761.1 DNA repair protein RadA [bacterium]